MIREKEEPSDADRCPISTLHVAPGVRQWPGLPLLRVAGAQIVCVQLHILYRKAEPSVHHSSPEAGPISACNTASFSRLTLYTEALKVYQRSSVKSST